MVDLTGANTTSVVTNAQSMWERKLLSGNEAVALSALHHGFSLATGYPGTPSTEILETLANATDGASRAIRAQWAPNEKVAFEVGLGAAFAGARVLVTMKHVGVNVAADTLFTAAYTSIPGAFVLVSADDPGMASSQNEQDNRRYAIASAIPILEPADSQQAYDFLGLAVQIAERWSVPVMLRMTTRVCHSKTVVNTRVSMSNATLLKYERDFMGRVMLPGNARRAHRILREKLAEIVEISASSAVAQQYSGAKELGVICSGISSMYVREAVPNASVLTIGMCHPAPTERMRAFASTVERCVVVEEGDPVLFEIARTAGILVEGKSEEFRFGELNVERVRQILTGQRAADIALPKPKPPALCVGCSHRSVFEILAKHQLVVSGDIGCYTLGALPPYSAIDTVVCMGASIGVGLGMRHVLDEETGRRVVSVIGDSTFIHSGIAGLIEMVYNPPESGHVVIVVDNGTTAMTGQQEHPATGRSLRHTPTNRISIEGIATAIGVDRVEVIDPYTEALRFERTLLEMLEKPKTAVIVARRACILSLKQVRRAVQQNVETSVNSLNCIKDAE
jgi:indolepyruvate ferredoxin oxidoreductase alpha subunit